MIQRAEINQLNEFSSYIYTCESESAVGIPIICVRVIDEVGALSDLASHFYGGS